MEEKQGGCGRWLRREKGAGSSPAPFQGQQEGADLPAFHGGSQDPLDVVLPRGAVGGTWEPLGAEGATTAAARSPLPLALEVSS